MPYENYEIEKKPFAKGGFGEVYMCKRKSDGKKFVIKKALHNHPNEIIQKVVSEFFIFLLKL